MIEQSKDKYLNLQQSHKIKVEQDKFLDRTDEINAMLNNWAFNKMDCQFIQLKKNFRSHRKILQMGNSIVRMLEMLQRGDLDIMDDEISELDGPLPIIIQRGEKIETLFKLLEETYGSKYNEEGNLVGSAEQVLIVRNEEEKRNLPVELQKIPAFTVVESKGLEFDDVILYNFFGSSEKYQCWNYLKKIAIEIHDMDEEKYQTLLERKAKSKSGLVDDYRYFKPIFDEENQIYHVPAIQMSKTIDADDVELYNYVNDELKALYVAITRAKKTFVVYDHTNQKNRANIDMLWRTLSIVDFVDKKAIEERYQKTFEKDQATIYSQWIYKGFDYLRREQFEHAMNCFKNLDHKKCMHLCRAFLGLEEVQRKEYYITMNQHMNTVDLQTTLTKDYIEIAGNFVKSDKYSDAALCYFNAQHYSKARDNFLKCGKKKESAQMSYMLGHYTAAANMFYEIGDWFSCLVCKELKGNATDFLEVLVKLFKADTKDENKSKYLALFIKYMKKHFKTLEEKTIEEIRELDNKERGTDTEVKKIEAAPAEEPSNQEPEQETEEVKENTAEPSDMSSFHNIASENGTAEELAEFEDPSSLENISGVESFQLIKDLSEQAADNLMNESFINVEFDEDGQAMSVGDSAFKPIGLKGKNVSKMFVEEKVVSEILKFSTGFEKQIMKEASKFNIKQLPKRFRPTDIVPIDEEDSDSEGEFDIDSLENAQYEENKPLVNGIIDFLIDWNLDELHWMFVGKFTTKDRLRKIVFKLIEDYSLVATKRNKYIINQLYAPKTYFRMKDANRITTLAFKAIFSRIPEKMLQIGEIDDPNCLFSLQDLQILVLFGFLKQIYFMLPYKDNKRLMTLFGEIDTLGMIWCKKELPTQEAKDLFVRRAVPADTLGKIQLICEHYYEEDLLEAALFKLMKFSFWSSFTPYHVGKIMAMANNEHVQKCMPDLCQTIVLLNEYSDIIAGNFSAVTEKEEEHDSEYLLGQWLKKVNTIISGIVDVNKDQEGEDENAGKQGSRKIMDYQKGMCYGIWYSFFYLKVPPNCPILLKEKELNEMPLYTKADLFAKVGMFTKNARLGRFLQIIFEKFTIDVERFIHKFDTHSPVKRGYWSVYLIREIEPSKLKYLKVLGYQKYYIVHKMSHLSLLTGQLQSSDVSFLDNSLELIAIKKNSFEATVTEYLRAYERKRVMIEIYNEEKLRKIRLARERKRELGELEEGEEVDPFKQKYADYLKKSFLPHMLKERHTNYL